MNGNESQKNHHRLQTTDDKAPVVLTVEEEEAPYNGHKSLASNDGGSGTVTIQATNASAPPFRRCKLPENGKTAAEAPGLNRGVRKRLPVCFGSKQSALPV